MITISFFVPGLPKGQPRARAFSFGGKARLYDPGTAEGWKGCIAAACKDHKPTDTITTPVELTLAFYMPRPKKHFKGTNLRHDAPDHFTGKPDADNLAKAVMDALTMLGWWSDDSLVWSLNVEKWYAQPAAGMTLTLTY